ncbi:MAG: hypothetical protein K2Q18_00795 [Bdellovibrionales bacterium]|nr:hypothetical protein [Bdellovibrionales bacterium]
MVIEFSSPHFAPILHRYLTSEPVLKGLIIDKSQISPPIDFDFASVKTNFELIPPYTIERDLSYDKMYINYPPTESEGRFRKNAVTKVLLKNNVTEEILYQGDYSLDSFRRRKTVGSDIKVQNVIVIDGCSFVFGDYVNDDETLPSRIQSRLKNTSVKNLGISGGSPTYNMYYHSKYNWEILDDIDINQKGYVIFMFADFHVQRMFAQSSWIGFGKKIKSSIFNPPIMKKNNLGKFEFTGLFEDYYGIFAQVQREFAVTNISKIFKVNYPYKGYQETIEDSSELILQNLNEITKRKPNLTPVVLIVPGSKYYGPGVAKIIQKKGILVMDDSIYSFKDLLRGQILTKEGHPNVNFYDLLASLVVRDLKVANKNINL